MTILAVCGLQRERRILSSPGVEVAVGAGDLDRLTVGKRGVISIGIAGALAPGLRPGTWVVAAAVRDGNDLLPTDPDWTTRLIARLPAAERDAQQQVVLQILADAGQIHEDVDPVCLQMVRGADAGDHQQARGVHGARTQHDLLAGRRPPSLAGLEVIHSHRPPPGQGDARGLGKGFDPQVAAAKDRPEARREAFGVWSSKAARPSPNLC